MAPVDATASLRAELKRLVPVPASLLLLVVVAAFSQPAGAQGTCGDGVCDPGETALTCSQDCCANRAWDAGLGEDGGDCGGTCTPACQPADRLDRWTQTNSPWLEYIRRIRFDPDDPDNTFQIRCQVPWRCAI